MSTKNDAIVFCADCHENQPMIGRDRLLDEVKLLADAAQASNKPHYLMNTRPGVMNQAQVTFLAERGIPQIGGTRQGLRAIGRLGRYAMTQPRDRQATATPKRELATLLAAEPGRRTINEFHAKQFLASYGLPVAREHLVDTLAEARRVAGEIGYPVVLKVVSDDVPHKTEHGLVATGLSSEHDVVRAWEILAKRVKRIEAPVAVRGFLVQEFIADGVEVFAGVARDPDFGLSISFGIGGLGIEVARDSTLRLLPLREGDVQELVRDSRGSALLGPYRGRPRADVQSLIECLYGLADFAHCEGDHISEIDLNPIKVRREGLGSVIVDALIVAR
jgi:acyl-CoA synthetase (NDP forming)